MSATQVKEEFQMKAFHGDPEVKKKYLARVKAHRKADQIIKGQYWEEGKGCAVGCTIHGSDHQAYETELGIPVQLAHLQDCLFEDLPNEEAKDFPVDFLDSIPVGADLELVLHQFLYWLLVDPEDGVIQYAQGEGEKQMKESILAVADLHNRVIKGQKVTNKQWIAVNNAAAAAAEATSEAAWAASNASSATARAASTTLPVSAASGRLSGLSRRRPGLPGMLLVMLPWRMPGRLSAMLPFMLQLIGKRRSCWSCWPGSRYSND